MPSSDMCYVSLDAHALALVLPHVAGPKERRAVLQGVCIEPNGWAVCTNGKTLGAMPGVIADGSLPYPIIIDATRSVLDLVKSATKKTASGKLTLWMPVDPNSPMLPKLRYEGTEHTIRFIEGPFPQWRGVVPAPPYWGDRAWGTLMVWPDMLKLFTSKDDRGNVRPLALFLDAKLPAYRVSYTKDWPDFVGAISTAEALPELGIPQAVPPLDAPYTWPVRSTNEQE